MKRNAFCFLMLLLLATSVAAEEIVQWKLPQALTDENISVSFEVDTTWHVVHGEVRGISGSVFLADKKDLNSIQAEIHFPVKQFDTDWGMRDDSLREHMKAEEFPEVVLTTGEFLGDCDPNTINEQGCSAELKASLQICDVTKDIKLPVVIKKKDGIFIANGSYTFAWAKYNVDDPSMFMAKVKPDVTVKYSITIPVEKAMGLTKKSGDE